MTERAIPDNTNPAYIAAGQAQKDAANPDHSAWVVANAGSGKTKVLIDRVARLLLKKADPDSILCVTYTKAAANEMLERLFKTLGAWSIMDAKQLREKLGDLEGRTVESYSDQELTAARALFARALETPGGLRIETIHAFCGRILRRFPLEAGVPPGFREIEEDDTNDIWESVTRAALLNPDTDRSVIDLLSLEAGFGGAQKAFRNLRYVGEAARQFASEYSNGSDEMMQALAQELKAPDKSQADLLHMAMDTDFPAETLRSVLPVLDVGAKSDIATAEKLRDALNADTNERRWTIYRSIFTTAAGGWRASNPYTAKSAKYPEVPDLFQMKDGDGSETARVKQLDADLARRAMFDRSYALLKAGLPVLNGFDDEKRDRAALDFDDLILRAKYLLTEAGAAAWVLYKLDGGLSHVLLDEAQDTSPSQWALLNALTEEFFAGDGIDRAQNPRTTFVVGDEKQSIFGFQGADPEHFMEERVAFRHKAETAFGQAVLPDMAMSFRSSPEILGFVDESIVVTSPNSDPQVRHTARRDSQPGLVELFPIEVPDPEEDGGAWDAPVDVLGAESPVVKLATRIAEHISALVSRGDTIWEEQSDRSWQRRAATPGDVLILVQKRGPLFDAIIEALKAAGLPVAGADRLVLTDHIGVQDCLNLMRFVLLPEDDLTLAEIIRGPFGGLAEDDHHLYPLAYQRPASLWDRLRASENPDHQRLTGFLEALLDRRHRPPYEFLIAALHTLPIGGVTGYAHLIGRLGAPAKDPLDAFLGRALGFDSRGRASNLQGFVSAMDRDTSQIKRDLAAPNGDIRVMTAHGAKGLQAPIIVMPDTTSAGKNDAGHMFTLNGIPIWAGPKAGDTPETSILREEAVERLKAERLRLLYVALTRAQDRLMIYGKWSGRRPDPDKEGQTVKGYADGSWYDVCLQTMQRLNEGADETGIWRYGPPPPQAVRESTDQKSVPGPPPWLGETVPDEARGLTMLAPSALVQDDSAVLAPFGPGLPDRLRRGRLIHALLQRLPDIAPDQRRAAGHRFLALDQTVTEKQAGEMLDATMGVLEHQDFKDIFARGGRAEAPIVGTAPILGDSVLLNGRVDRLIVTETDILVVDYKTDRPAPSSVSGVGEAYLAQMGAYAAILSEAWPDRRIRAALVWTDGPRLMELPADLLEKALLRSSKTV